MFLALVLGVVSCQTEPEGFDVNMGGEQEVLINVSLPEETRADSAKGFDLTTLATDSEYQLRYILEIYRDGAEEGKNYRDVKYSDDTSVAFPVRLVPGHKYTFAVWADIVKQVENPTDLYYNAASLKSISIIDEKWNAMDEKRDAFTGFAILEKGKSITDIQTINLTRPFAKVRVVTTDIKTIRTFGLEPKAATALYKVPVYTRFDATNASVAGEVNDKTLAFVYNNTYEQIGANELTLFTDYLFVGNNGNITKFNLEVFANAERTSSIKSNSFNTDIAIERNKLTTIKGDVLTEGGNIEVKIEDGLDDEIEYPIIDRTEPANNEIWYTSTDGSVVNPRSNTDFGANIISNTYYGGRGIITFDGDVTKIGEEAFYGSSKLVSIHIPEGVTTIKDSAFHHCIVLEAINLPQGLREIGPSAFAVCYKLNGITIPNSVTTIDDNAFYHCESLTNINIPEGVSSINYYTFAWCTNLESVTIPDSVTHIGECAFIYCESLTNITIPDSVISIGDSPFGMCPNIKKFEGKGACDNGLSLIFDNSLYAFAVGSDIEVYTVPNNVKKIKWAAFAGAHLKQITLPEGLTDIDLFAFAHNSSLTSIIVPSSVKTIGTRAFYNCPNLENVYNYSYTPQVADIDVFLDCSDNLKIYVPHQSLDAYKSAEGWREYADKIFGCPPANEIWYTNGSTTEPTSPFSTNPFDSDSISNYYDDSKGCWVITFDNAISKVGGYAFYSTNLTGMIIPEGVQTIGSTAFFGCMNLPTITLPRTLITIDEDAFNDSGLATITIPENVEYIGKWAFAFCDNLKGVFCKATTPPTLGASPFLQCPSNLQIYVPAESYWDYISAEDWAYHKDCIVAYDFENNCVVATPAPTKPASNEIWYTNGSTTEPTYPYNSDTFDSYIISNNYDDSRGCWVITFNSAISYVGNYAFYNTNLTSIVIPKGVTDINYDAFRWCYNMTNVTLPNTLRNIYDNAFNDCGFSTIVIPENVEHIGEWAFFCCNNLEEVYCKAITPPSLGYSPFSQCSSNLQIYVPAESVDAYKSAEGWSSYADRIEGYNF